mmetsp:Transcript_11036/g.24684  ORF Transcript_11036/g.24684 Transcript_11036/m.24684 type:complete len:155 (+) Transcript_11036:299-763(+)
MKVLKVSDGGGEDSSPLSLAQVARPLPPLDLLATPSRLSSTPPPPLLAPLPCPISATILWIETAPSSALMNLQPIQCSCRRKWANAVLTRDAPLCYQMSYYCSTQCEIPFSLNSFKSASTISLHSSSTVVVARHPSFAFAFDGSPSSCSTSAGL